jgi:hypothetical protein
MTGWRRRGGAPDAGMSSRPISTRSRIGSLEFACAAPEERAYAVFEIRQFAPHQVFNLMTIMRREAHPRFTSHNSSYVIQFVGRPV